MFRIIPYGVFFLLILPLGVLAHPGHGIDSFNPWGLVHFVVDHSFSWILGFLFLIVFIKVLSQRKNRSNHSCD